jgi:hypothetical protein
MEGTSLGGELVLVSACLTVSPLITGGQHTHTQLTIDNTLEGRWMRVSWHRKVGPNGNIGFYASDVGVISSIIQNKVQISFAEEDKSYTVPLKSNKWTKCVNFPPSRQYQWQLLSKKASLSFLKGIFTNTL